MRSYRRLALAGVATLLHASFTLAMFWSYVETAMAVSHGAPVTSFTTLFQHAKAIFLWPILLPLLKNYPRLLDGWSAFSLLMLNSLVWIVGMQLLYRAFCLRRASR